MTNFAKRFLPAEIHKVLVERENRAAICMLSNRKGGTGKTTLTLNIGEGFALLAGKRVLLIDVDRQANLSTAYGLTERMTGQTSHAFSETGVRPNELLVPPIHPDYEEGDQFAARSSSAEVMEQDGKPVLPYGTFIDGEIECLTELNPLGGCVDVLPADGERLKHIQTHAENYNARALYASWANWLYSSGALTNYDAIIFDAPPLDSELHEALYQLCDHMIVPVQPSNDTLSAASAVAYSCFGAQNSDERPRTMTTIINPLSSNRLTNEQRTWLENVVWNNQFLGALPESHEFPRANIIDKRRNTPLPPYDEEHMLQLSDDERIVAEKEYIKDIRKLVLPTRTTKADKSTRDRLVRVMNHLHDKILGEPLPKDPFVTTKSTATSGAAKGKKKANA
ncbi:ParA family protein [Pseudoalteromonas umbrosa]|uniref:ParA family protein n=1 Tax=Pseudoalteromonas umbrosa TaxID=3048489 RepID=UPI0024C2DD4F|nr:ParA family protein [Pseudoalteromonas sp. B95]MDK1290099.1 ParA family protein [Pseudoalteromonas sp. B95]